MLKYAVTAHQVWHNSQNGSVKMVKFMMARLKRIHDNMETFQNANVKNCKNVKVWDKRTQIYRRLLKTNVNW